MWSLVLDCLSSSSKCLAEEQALEEGQLGLESQELADSGQVSTALSASRVALVVKSPPANAGVLRGEGLIPGSGRSPGGGHGNPRQCSCLENPVVRGARRLRSTGSRRVGHDCREHERMLNH